MRHTSPLSRVLRLYADSLAIPANRGSPMLRNLIFAACLGFAAACTGPADTAELLADTRIRAGTAFGMCLGYCMTELRVAPDEVLFVESSRDPAKYPDRVRRAALQPGEWEEIVALARPSQLEGLKEVYGCPDCADGGAEWIEVESGGTRRRVTFEYGSRVEPIQPLIDKARALRQRFPR